MRSWIPVPRPALQLLSLGLPLDWHREEIKAAVRRTEREYQ